MPVCQAVQHAHQKGIIHRDIKPSNVLVAEYDDRPVPKIIDFGVAKATEQRLTEKTMFTQFGQVVGTVEYMSPEQAKLNQLDIDTRSDIYSLGVLLYELLTGETPFDRQRLRSAAFDEMLRIIREEEPPKPSLRLSTSQSLPSIAANRHVEPKTAEHAGPRRAGLDRDEGPGEGPHAAVRDGQRLCRRHRALLERRAGRGLPAVGGATASASSHAEMQPCSPQPLASPWSCSWGLWARVGWRSEPRAQNNSPSSVTNRSRTRGEKPKRRDWQRPNRETCAVDAESLAVERLARAEAAENSALAEARRAEDNVDVALAALDKVYVEMIGRQRSLDSGEESKTYPSKLSASEEQLLRAGLEFYTQIAEQNAENETATFRTALALNRVGMLQKDLKDLDSAINAFRRAVQRLTSIEQHAALDAPYWKELGRAHVQLGLLSKWLPSATDRFQEAVEALDRSIALDPEDADAFHLRGTAYESLAMKKKGVEDFELRCRTPAHSGLATGRTHVEIWPQRGPASYRQAKSARPHSECR